ncbi:peptidoglycan D,D-transpeptidase FtsI family protein [Smaragdicoccus niigatensis]|uniref:peptidoglycan D,D-transpeptidase FtsI family protein n=1 Tax=Smaragdicoccus niigatensis TaxID=359359 RepID=UPI00036A8376|nr:penicillin-binding protein 2 [Smaragdicoccus niigatensis]
MNTPLRKVAIGVMVMIVALMGNATYVQVIKADQLRNDPRNSRVLLDEYSRERGQITSFDGQILAISNPSDDRFKFQREYPEDPKAFAPVTGFYSIQYGSSGLERAEDGILAGSDNRLFGRRFIDMLQGRDPRGGNVVTTINPTLQKIAYEQLTSRGYTGSVVALEPSTGKILALVSTPSYNPSSLASHNATETTDAWSQLANDPTRPLANRAVNELYPPGSIFKIITSAAALEHGFTPASQVTGAASITLPGTNTPLPNYGDQSCSGGAKTVTLTVAFANSCNTAFAEVAQQIGEDAFRSKAEEFGLDKKPSNIPLSVAESELGDIPDEPALMQSAIGQKDVKITPLEGAIMAATVANGGVRMRPQLVAGLQGPDRSTVWAMDPESQGEAMSPSTAQQITQMMIESEKHSGGGYIGGAQVASKTGTADAYTSPNPFCWYVAFAPATNPKIAIAVMVENGGGIGPGAVGATVAAPTARAVMAAALQGS